jgi:AhpD family alkylhydroperoxidase
MGSITTQESATPLINYLNVAPGAFKAMVGLESYLRGCGLGPSLIEMVKLRVSQINRCACCIDMHTKKLVAEGESNDRVHRLQAWREGDYYSAREQTALAWAEAVTRIVERHIDDSLYQKALETFTEKELVDLTLAIVAINGWNRLNISFRIPPGYQF